MRDKLFRGNAEPTIHELLSDPIAELLRQRDRIGVDDVLATIEHAREALRYRHSTHGCCTEATA